MLTIKDITNRICSKIKYGESKIYTGINVSRDTFKKYQSYNFIPISIAEKLCEKFEYNINDLIDNKLIFDDKNYKDPLIIIRDKTVEAVIPCFKLREFMGLDLAFDNWFTDDNKFFIKALNLLRLKICTNKVNYIMMSQLHTELNKRKNNEKFYELLTYYQSEVFPKLGLDQYGKKIKEVELKNIPFTQINLVNETICINNNLDKNEESEIMNDNKIDESIKNDELNMFLVTFCEKVKSKFKDECDNKTLELKNKCLDYKNIINDKDQYIEKLRLEILSAASKYNDDFDNYKCKIAELEERLSASNEEYDNSIKQIEDKDKEIKELKAEIFNIKCRSMYNDKREIKTNVQKDAISILNKHFADIIAA